MFLAYYDESGDDGFPNTSSPLFVLTALYQHHLNWKENYERVKAFKRQLAHDFPFPFHEELHTREFVLNKAPYHRWAYLRMIALTLLIYIAKLRRSSKRNSSTL